MMTRIVTLTFELEDGAAIDEFTREMARVCRDHGGFLRVAALRENDGDDAGSDDARP